MKSFLPILFVFLCTGAYGQLIENGDIRAVIIGISDYENKEIPDLSFADKDAELLFAYLRSPAGGQIPKENIRLLTNNEATTAQIAGALEWLVEKSQMGDQAIIYFSGHGDVETKTMFQLGFLLTSNSPSKTYVAGAFPLSYLQAIVTTLSLQNKSRVLLITDACRAGKLAGSSIGGTEQTNANLAKQFANEIKILSCQPNEFSLEGIEWGGGHGAFTYHLINGLYGLADMNNDLSINLLEIERYLEDKVPAETAPQSQIPMTVGTKSTKVALVDPDILANLKEQRKKEIPSIAKIESKGIEETVLNDVDTSIQLLYQAFLDAIESSHLLVPLKGSAYDLWQKLSQKVELKRLQGTMRRNLAAALQDDAQKSINAYLEANPTELKKRYEGDKDYDRFILYLEKAAEILGEENFYHPFILSKLYYFKGLKIRLNADLNKPNNNYKDAIELQEKALQYQEFSPFVYNELGILHTRLKLDMEAFEYYEKAIELSPQWGLPYVNYAVSLFYFGQLEKAIEVGEEGGERLSGYPEVYGFLAWINAKNFNWEDKSDWDRKGIELKSDWFFRNDETGTIVQNAEQLEKSKELLEKAIAIDSTFFAGLVNLAYIYARLGDSQKAIEFHKKAFSYGPQDKLMLVYLAMYYRQNMEYEKSIDTYLKAIEIDSLYQTAYNDLGVVYKEMENWDRTIEVCKKAASINPKWQHFCNIAEAYSKKGRYREAEYYYYKSLQISNGHPQAYFMAGCFFKDFQKKYQEAEWLLKKGLDINPQYLRANRNLLYTYIKQGKLEEALKWAKNGIKIAPNNGFSSYELGMVHYLLKEYPKADSFFNVAITGDTTKWSWRYPNIVGWFYNKHGVFELAEKYLLKAIKIKNDYEPYTSLSQLYFFHDQIPKAVDVLKQYLEKNPDDRRIQQQLLITSYFVKPNLKLKQQFLTEEDFSPGFFKIWDFLEAYRLNQFARAVEIWESKKKQLETWQFEHLYLEALVQSNQMAKVAEVLENASIWGFNYKFMTSSSLLDPLRNTNIYKQYMRLNFPEKFNDLGDLTPAKKRDNFFIENLVELAHYFEIQNDQENANEYYNKVIALKQGSLSVLEAFNLAEAYLNLNRKEESLSICPDSLVSDLKLEMLDAGKILYLLGKSELANIQLEKYISSSLKGPNDYKKVAAFYWAHGESELAKVYLKKAIKRFPDLVVLKASLARFYFFNGEARSSFRLIEKALYQEPKNPGLQINNALLKYYHDPIHAQAYFESSDLPRVFESLELMRTNQFTTADEKWNSLKQNFKAWWMDLVAYKYLQMKTRQGKNDLAIQILDELLRKNRFLSFPYIQTDPELRSILNHKSFKELLKRYFPEKK